mmetsp:Transcript_5685/g.14425  ORF Transcript_5685/g.14425 Transcript_5685/m.14425 type:complete len:204 (-) Transcript_5685:96-707(-)
MSLMRPTYSARHSSILDTSTGGATSWNWSVTLDQCDCGSLMTMPSVVRTLSMRREPQPATKPPSLLSTCAWLCSVRVWLSLGPVRWHASAISAISWMVERISESDDPRARWCFSRSVNPEYCIMHASTLASSLLLVMARSSAPGAASCSVLPTLPIAAGVQRSSPNAELSCESGHPAPLVAGCAVSDIDIGARGSTDAGRLLP